MHVAYCWSHGATKDLQNCNKSYRDKKKGHCAKATNKHTMNSVNNCMKLRRKWDDGHIVTESPWPTNITSTNTKTYSICLWVTRCPATSLGYGCDSRWSFPSCCTTPSSLCSKGVWCLNSRGCAVDRRYHPRCVLHGNVLGFEHALQREFALLHLGPQLFLHLLLLPTPSRSSISFPYSRTRRRENTWTCRILPALSKQNGRLDGLRYPPKRPPLAWSKGAYPRVAFILNIRVSALP